MQQNSWINEIGEFDYQRLNREIRNVSFRPVHFSEQSRSTISIKDISQSSSLDDYTNSDFPFAFQKYKKGQQTKKLQLRQQQGFQSELIRCSFPLVCKKLKQDIQDIDQRKNKYSYKQQHHKIRSKSSSQKTEQNQVNVLSMMLREYNVQYQQSTKTSSTCKSIRHQNCCFSSMPLENYQNMLPLEIDYSYDSDYVQLSLQKTRLKINETSQSSQQLQLKFKRMDLSQIITSQQRRSLEQQLLKFRRNNQDQQTQYFS